MSKSFIFSFIIGLSALFLSSCSIFQSSKKLDMAPFSENAGILFGEAAKISRPFMWKHLKTYTNIPEFKRLQENAMPILKSLNGIVYYSHQVVAINNSRLNDKEKNRQLAHYLGEVLQKAGEKGQLDSLGLSRETLQTIMKNIPNAETYLDAIKEASPIVNSVVLAVQNSLDGLQEDIALLIGGFDKKIESDYAHTRYNYIGLKTLQAEIMTTYTLVNQMLMGHQNTLDSLLARDNSLVKFFPAGKPLDSTQLEAAEKYLLVRLNNIDDVVEQLSDDVAGYYAKQDELEIWRINIDEKIRVARNAISVWAQSHRNLGAGIPVPPLIDMAGIASGLVGTATGMVLP